MDGNRKVAKCQGLKVLRPFLASSLALLVLLAVARLGPTLVQKAVLTPFDRSKA
jgi:hypothetical protein